MAREYRARIEQRSPSRSFSLTDRMLASNKSRFRVRIACVSELVLPIASSAAKTGENCFSEVRVSAEKIEVFKNHGMERGFGDNSFRNREFCVPLTSETRPERGRNASESGNANSEESG
jgi:hypothetical protein